MDFCWQAASKDELRVPYPPDYGSPNPSEEDIEKRDKLPELTDDELRLARMYMPYRKASEKLNWLYSFTKKFAAKVENASERIMKQRPKYNEMMNDKS